VGDSKQIAGNESKFLIRVGHGIFLLSLLTVPILIAPFAHNAYEDIKFLTVQVTGLTLGALLISLLLCGFFSLDIKDKRIMTIVCLSFFFLFVNAISTFFTVNRSESLHHLKSLAAYMCVGGWVFLFAHKESFLQRILNIMSLVTGIVALYGVCQFAGYDFLDLETPRVPVSTLGNVNFVAQFYMAALPVVAIAVFVSRGSFEKGYRSFVLTLALIHLLLTHSRGGYVAGVTGGAVFLILLRHLHKRTGKNVAKMFSKLGTRHQRYVIIVGLIILIGTFIFLDRGEVIRESVSIFSPTHESNRYRVQTWKSTLEMVKTSPFLGVGIGNFRFTFPKYKSSELWEIQDPWGKILQIRTHNDYLNILAEIGIIGFGIFLFLVGFVLVSSIKTFMHHDSHVRALCHVGSITALVATLIHSLFDFNLYSPSSALYFWVAVGLAAGLALEHLPRIDPTKKRGVMIIFIPLLLVTLTATLYLNIDGFKRFVSSVYVRKASVLTSHGRFNDALFEYNRAQRIYPDSIDAVAGAADLLRRTEEYRTAFMEYQKWLRLEPYLLPIYTRAGFCLTRIKDYDKAYDYFMKGLDLNPRNPVLLNNVANLLLLTHEYERALEFYTKARSTENRFNRENRINFARALYAIGNYEAARDILMEAYEDNPSDLHVMRLLAETELALGNHAQSESLYLRLYLICPTGAKQFYRDKWKEVHEKYERSRNE